MSWPNNCVQRVCGDHFLHRESTTFLQFSSCICCERLEHSRQLECKHLYTSSMDLYSQRVLLYVLLKNVLGLVSSFLISCSIYQHFCLLFLFSLICILSKQTYKPDIVNMCSAYKLGMAGNTLYSMQYVEQCQSWIFEGLLKLNDYFHVILSN